ncbi:MAG: hypothetical protein Q8Q01_02235 [archaeon]|nr:hypothetical protein [archaeon]
MANSTATSTTTNSGSNFGTGPDWGFYLFLAGLLNFFINEFTFSSSSITVWFGYTLMIYAALFVFKKRSIITVAAFIIWFEILGAPRDVGVISTTVLPVVVIFLLVDFLISRYKYKDQEDMRETLKGAVGGGALLVLIFFLEIGTVDYLAQIFNIVIPVTLQALIALIPWWAFLGLLNMHPGKNSFKTTLAFLFVVYLILIIISTFVFSSPGDIETSTVSYAEEIARQTKEQGVGRLDLITANFECFLTIFDYDPSRTYASCKQEKEQELQWGANCKSQGLVKGTREYQVCLAEQEAQKNNPAQTISGTYDPTLNQPMIATLNFQANQRSVFIPGSSITAFLEIKNPRKNLLTIQTECMFKKRGSDETIRGIMEGNSDFENSQQEFKTSLSCKPSELLKGSYDVEITAYLRDIVILSHQEKAFIGDSSKREQLQSEIKSIIPNARSQSAPDFAQLIFTLSYGDDNDPIVISDQNVNLVLASKIKNVGRGEVVEIKKYQIDLPGFQTGGDSACFNGGPVTLPPKIAREILLPSCIISDYPDGLKPTDPDKWEHIDVRGLAVIDYKIKETQSLPNIE